MPGTADTIERASPRRRLAGWTCPCWACPGWRCASPACAVPALRVTAAARGSPARRFGGSARRSAPSPSRRAVEVALVGGRHRRPARGSPGEWTTPRPSRSGVSTLLTTSTTRSASGRSASISRRPPRSAAHLHQEQRQVAPRGLARLRRATWRSMPPRPPASRRCPGGDRAGPAIRHSPSTASRVTPGVGSVMASWRPMSALNSEDLPTLGRPRMATRAETRRRRDGRCARKALGQRPRRDASAAQGAILPSGVRHVDFPRARGRQLRDLGQGHRADDALDLRDADGAHAELSRPRPSSTTVASGSAAISPHIPTGMPLACALSIVVPSSRSTPG